MRGDCYQQSPQHHGFKFTHNRFLLPPLWHQCESNRRISTVRRMHPESNCEGKTGLFCVLPHIRPNIKRCVPPCFSVLSVAGRSMIPLANVASLLRSSPASGLGCRGMRGCGLCPGSKVWGRLVCLVLSEVVHAVPNRLGNVPSHAGSWW